MKDSYSLYEAKARLSALVRQVREGHPVTITVHGEPAVELRAVTPAAKGIDQRIAELKKRGIVAPASKPDAPLKVGPKRTGALKRFITSRD